MLLMSGYVTEPTHSGTTLFLFAFQLYQAHQIIGVRNQFKCKIIQAGLIITQFVEICITLFFELLDFILLDGRLAVN